MASSACSIWLVGLASSALAQEVARAPRGLVLDTLGNPVGGLVLVSEEGGSPVARSEADGTFAAELPDPDGGPLCIDAGQPWVAVARCHCSAIPGGPAPLLVVAPAVEVRGQVIDESGKGVAGANVWLGFELEDLPYFPWPLCDADLSWDLGETDETGACRIQLPDCPGGTLGAGVWDNEGLVVEAEVSTDALLRDDKERRFVLRALAPQRIAGRVRFVDGRPAGGARIVSGRDETECAADGSFGLELRFPMDVGLARPLCASLAGWAPVIVPDVTPLLGAGGGSSLDLVMEEEALSISGSVRGSAGRPLAGWRVELHDGVELNPGVSPVVLAEHHSGGRGAHGDPVETDASGRFEIHGLSRRTYVLDAWGWAGKEDHPIVLRSGPVQAGERVELLVPEAPFHEQLLGRVVDREGQGISAAQVEVWFDLPLTVEGHSNSVYAPSTVTDAEGRFVLADVARHGAILSLSGPGLFARSLPVPADLGGGELTFVVDRTAWIRFLYLGADPVPTSISVVDEDGAVLPLVAGDPTYGDSYTRFPLRHRSTHPLLVSERATALVAFANDVPVGRVPLRLRPYCVYVAALE